MPLPLIPALIIAGSVLTGGAGGAMTVNAVSRVKEAERRYKRRRNAYEEAEARYTKSRKAADTAFERLGKCRLEAVVTLGQAVDFLKRARLKDRELFENVEITPEHLEAWEGASANAVDVLTGLGKGGAAGAAAAAAAYGLVGKLAAASTGTAISMLSGAAAKSATLAWLGGGSLAAGGGGVALGTAVLGGIVAGPALLVVGFFASAKAEEAETQVAEAIAEMDIAEMKMEQQLAVLKVILQRVDELHTATDQVDRALQALLETSSVDRMEDVYAVARTAKALADLLDVAILDEDGNLLTY